MGLEPVPDHGAATPATATEGEPPLPGELRRGDRRAGELRLGDLRREYLEGRRTPVETVEDVLRRIAAVGDRGVWISTVPAEALRRRAAALAARQAADPDVVRRLPLYGVPFAVKDNIDVEGLDTTAACPAFGYRPERTATVVRRLLAAGAMLVGKTNLDQFATGLTGSRSPYGRLESALGGGLIAGGSSSGSAVAVAAGLVAFALGTDTAGSGRVPAALNGIVGLKPSRGVLPTTGVLPACRSLDCVSVFAADVAGAMTVFDVAQGVDDADPWSRALPDAPVGEPGTLRLGVGAPGDLEFFGDTGQSRAYAAGVARAARLTAGVTEVGLGPFVEAGDLLYLGPWVAERLATLGGFVDRHPDALLAVTRSVLETGRRHSAVDAFRARHRLQELRAAARRVFTRVDALLLPTVGTTFTLDEIAEEPLRRNLMLGRYTQFANPLDLAVVTIPNGFTADGRPASLSVIGPAFADRTLARLAATLTAEPRLPHTPTAEPRLPGTPTAGSRRPGTPAGGPLSDPPVDPSRTVVLAVVGRHLRGESRNGELTGRGATLVATTRTAPTYRLYRLPVGEEGLPGLVRVSTGGVSVEVELWRIPETEVGGLLAGVPAPLSFGWVHLDGGGCVLGFLCEAAGVGGGCGAGAVGGGAAGDVEDISASGGWRAYRRAMVTT